MSMTNLSVRLGHRVEDGGCQFCNCPLYTAVNIVQGDNIEVRFCSACYRRAFNWQNYRHIYEQETYPALSGKEPDRPLFTHDCKRCVFLGNFNGHDLYYCHDGEWPTVVPTVVARYSSECSCFRSGLPAVGLDPEVTEAARRAVEKGFLDPDAETRRDDKSTIAEAISLLDSQAAGNAPPEAD